jgi:hypothetical protein
MKYAAAHPDHFSKMSDHLAKLPFKLNSVMEQIHHLSKLIGKEQELLEYMRDNKDGTALTTYHFALQFLKTQLESNEFKSMDVLVQRSAKANMNAIEYSVSVGVIFNEILLHEQAHETYPGQRRQNGTDPV